MTTADKKPNKINIVNRRASFEFFFIAQYEAGIELTGTEIKSIRRGSADLRDAYCFFKKGELFVKNLYIAEYNWGNQFNHETRRERKLLLRGAELRKLEKKIKERGFTIVPYRLYINDRGFAKLEIALAQGKKMHDKRTTIKEREGKRDLDRVKKTRD